MKQYFFNIFLSFDRFLNTILGGSPQYSISGRMGKDISEGRCKICAFICKGLNFFQSDHCNRAFLHDEQTFGPPSDAVDHGD